MKRFLIASLLATTGVLAAAQSTPSARPAPPPTPAPTPAAAAAPAAPVPGAPLPPAGTLKVVSGDVRVVGTDYEERKVQPGDRIASTERLLTGKDSAASLVLRDGTVLALGPRTNVDLRRFSYDSTTQEGSLALQLVRGSMRMISGLIGKTRPEAVSIATRTATVGIRGTDIIVSADEDLP